MGSEQHSIDSDYLFVPGEERLKSDVQRAAATDRTLLILGPTGSGKTELARYIHSHSSRTKGPFEHLNCATLPDSLVESELFGYERGAYTDAKESRDGILMRGKKGTVFLDEFGHAPKRMYHGLLKFLVDKTVRPLGSKLSKHSNVRIICATDQDLAHVSAALMRRLTEWPSIYLRPLRVRRLKKWLLFKHFIESKAQQEVSSVESLLWFFVVGFDWPSNVGQLKGFAEYLLSCGFLQDGSLRLDPEFRYFDGSHLLHYHSLDWETGQGDPVNRSSDDPDTFPFWAEKSDGEPPYDDLVYGETPYFRNTIHRDFRDIVRALQSDSDALQHWKRYSCGKPLRRGTWEYPCLQWNDPWLTSSEAIYNLGQMYTSALMRERNRRKDDARPPIQVAWPWQTPWAVGSSANLPADTPALDALVSGVANLFIDGRSDSKTFLNHVYGYIENQNPDASRSELEKMGVPKHRYKDRRKPSAQNGPN